MTKETQKQLCAKEIEGMCLHGNTNNCSHLLSDLVELAKSICGLEKLVTIPTNLGKKSDVRLHQDLLSKMKNDPEFSQFLFSAFTKLMLIKN